MIKRGEGLYIVSEADVPGISLKTQIKEYDILLTINNKELYKDIPAGKFCANGIEMEGESLIIENGTHTFEVLHSSITKEYPLGDFYMVGYSYFHDGTLDTGFSYYGSIVGSYMDKAALDVQPLFDSGKLNPIIYQMYPEAFEFDTNTYTGYAIDLGVRFDDELFNKEIWYCAEYFHRYGDFISGNYGSPHLGKYDKSFEANSDLKFVFGTRIDNNSRMLLTLEKKEFSGYPTKGYDGRMIISDIFDEPKSTDIIKLEYNIKF